MKSKSAHFIFVSFWLALLCSGSLRAETTNSKQALRFKNGDVLLGNLETVRADKSVVWKRNDVFQPIEFSGTNILAIKFPPGKKLDSHETNGCKIHFLNGDSLEGKLTQVDSEKIALETAFANKMILPRKFIRSIESLPFDGQAIFSGPTGLEGWTMGKVTVTALGDSGEWKFTNGAFYATRSASIGRDLKLPDVARIEFDLAWKDMLQAAIALYTSYMQPINLANKDTEPDFGGFYSLQLNSFVTALMPVKKKDPLVYLGQVPVPMLARKNRTHVDLFVNKPRASIALFFDGELVKEWIDPDGFAGTGTGMKFVHQGQGALRLSNLRVTEWNGKMEQKTTKAPPIKEDLAHLLNGDKVSGNLETFRDGKFTFSTATGALNIPFGRVTEVEFPNKLSGPETKMTGPVRATFAEGGNITFQIEQWTGGVATGTSPYFGRASFTTSAFESVELYPDFSKKVSESKSQSNDAAE